MATGKQVNNPGYIASAAYKADPDNATVPDSLHQEYEIGKTSFVLTDAQALLADVTVAQDTADEAVVNAATAQDQADQAVIDAAAAQSEADQAVIDAAAAQAVADAAVVDAATAQENADQALFGFTTVPTIAARNALTPSVDQLVSVTDSGNGTPKLYQWNGTAWLDVTATYVTYAALNVAVNADLIAANADAIAALAQTDADQALTDAALAQGIADNAVADALQAQTTADIAENVADQAALDVIVAQNGVNGINASIGIANGVASLDGAGLVPASQLPSYVDDVLEFANLASFPATGEASKIYIALDTDKQYRWASTVYVQIYSGAVDSVAGKTGVVTLVKTDVGLSNVDNTSDASKPVSVAQQTELDLKANTTTVNAALALKIDDSQIVTTVGTPGLDTNIPTEKAVRDVLASAGGGGLQWRQSITHTGASDVVTFSSAYITASGGLMVLADGVLLALGVDYTETSTTTITLIGNFASKATQIDGLNFGNISIGGGIGLVTTVSTPGLDTNVPSEKAVRDAIAAIPAGDPARKVVYVAVASTGDASGDDASNKIAASAYFPASAPLVEDQDIIIDAGTYTGVDLRFQVCNVRLLLQGTATFDAFYASTAEVTVLALSTANYLITTGILSVQYGAHLSIPAGSGAPFAVNLYGTNYTYSNLDVGSLTVQGGAHVASRGFFITRGAVSITSNSVVGAEYFTHVGATGLVISTASTFSSVTASWSGATIDLLSNSRFSCMSTMNFAGGTVKGASVFVYGSAGGTLPTASAGGTVQSAT